MQTHEEYLQTMTKTPIQKQSKFRNQNKKHLTKLIKFFNPKNLSLIELPEENLRNIQKIILNTKNSGRDIKQGIVKRSDIFNHSHYNVLFLKLTPETVSKLDKKKDFALHKLIFDVDLELFSDINKEKIEEINETKKYIYQIIKQHLESYMIGDESVREEREYEIRAFKGISLMNQGVYINRF